MPVRTRPCPRPAPLRARLHGVALALPLAIALAAAPGKGRADTGDSNGLGSPASASLRFAINIDKFVYLKLGGEGNDVPTVAYTLAPAVPGGPAPSNGNNRAGAWSGAAPTFTVSASGNALPVEVRSNGGTVSLRATTVTPLASGSATIPMSRIGISSSDSGLPAPPLADSGNGASVNVAGTAFGNRVTVRNATWTFTYAPTGAQMPLAGNYSGQVRFTASVP